MLAMTRREAIDEFVKIGLFAVVGLGWLTSCTITVLGPIKAPKDYGENSLIVGSVNFAGEVHVFGFVESRGELLVATQDSGGMFMERVGFGTTADEFERKKRPVDFAAVDIERGRQPGTTFVLGVTQQDEAVLILWDHYQNRQLSRQTLALGQPGRGLVMARDGRVFASVFTSNIIFGTAGTIPLNVEVMASFPGLTNYDMVMNKTSDRMFLSDTYGSAIHIFQVVKGRLIFKNTFELGRLPSALAYDSGQRQLFALDAFKDRIYIIGEREGRFVTIGEIQLPASGDRRGQLGGQLVYVEALRGLVVRRAGVAELTFVDLSKTNYQSARIDLGIGTIGWMALSPDEEWIAVSREEDRRIDFVRVKLIRKWLGSQKLSE